ncbi:AraC family transcriptional regulator [Rubinisphaera italica]|uniref:HTH-type transcriptional activator Btr n=1 Tax=Rubinisphaera italica TaxID=2527969 RepID=A0A5C5XD73_9PLAN|nr:AraC family transcriptional regulator [Rubinisphaera italica]TWT60569.1 HTH-type transcriptional activator Btr [Rubinisphaera italica]
MTDNSPHNFQSQFFENNPLAESLISLFDALPQTYFYVKDCQSRFVKVNHLFLENHGLTDESQALGKCDRDFHPPSLAQAYMDEDQRMMESRKALPGQVWLVLHRRRTPRWYVSTKTPLFNISGDVVGLAGAMYRIEDREELARHFHELLPVITFIEENFAESINMKEMAQLAGISSTHFNRRFRQLLHKTPLEYLRAIRTQSAQRMLTTTSRSLAEIAAASGFTDQSHLTRRFRQVTGMTPAAYRKKFRN